MKLTIKKSKQYPDLFELWHKKSRYMPGFYFKTRESARKHAKKIEYITTEQEYTSFSGRY